MGGSESRSSTSGLYFMHIHLLVTGKAEERHLPKLFSALEACSVCKIAVKARIPQWTPRTSTGRLKVVGKTGGKLPDRKESTISIPARTVLGKPDTLLVLIDDLEHDRREQVEEVFHDYRLAIDHLLNDEQKLRAGVHFLANMLEAYFIADSSACGRALGVVLQSFDGDVESIRNPKSRLKAVFPSYKEVEHGGKVLGGLDLRNVLANSDHCAWLRSCLAWLVQALQDRLHATVASNLKPLAESCHLQEGQCVPLTLHQRRATQ